MECDPICSASATMLDFRVYKGPRYIETTCFDYSPHIKVTARHVPLSGLSAHPPTVHDSWPVSEVNRMCRLSYHKQSFCFFRNLKIQRCRDALVHSCRLQRCIDWKPSRSPEVARARTLVVRAIVPWHPALAGLIRKLRHLSEQCRPSLCLGTAGTWCPSLQIGFTLASRPLQSFCRAHTCGLTTGGV